jgi:hypothetical protein
MSSCVRTFIVKYYTIAPEQIKNRNGKGVYLNTLKTGCFTGREHFYLVGRNVHQDDDINIMPKRPRSRLAGHSIHNNT